MASVVISGDTSGSITLSAPAAAGSSTISLPASTGNALVDIARSLANPGYIRLSNGLIIQWGQTGTVSASSGFSITFPIAFPTAAFYNMVQQVNNGTGNTFGTGSGTLSLTGITATSSANVSTTFRWLAIGN